MLAALVWACATGGVATPQPTPGEKPGKVVEVKIVIASLGEHLSACKAKKYTPQDILVLKQETLTLSCIGRRLRVHDHDEDDFPQTFVTLHFSSKDQVRWESSEPFSVEAFELEEGKYKENPFQSFKFPSGMAKSHVAGPIKEQAIGSRYKLMFKLGSQKIDPDVDCKP
jgi:hypothetical protein